MFAKGNAFLGFWYSRLFFEPPHGVWQGYGCEEHGIFKGNACAKVVKGVTLTDNKSNLKTILVSVPARCASQEATLRPVTLRCGSTPRYSRRCCIVPSRSIGQAHGIHKYN